MKSENIGKLLLTLKEVSDYLGIPLNTLKSWARQGKMPVTKLGKSVYCLKKDLDKWLSENTRYPEEGNCPLTSASRSTKYSSVGRSRKKGGKNERL